jgi:hypothetical protein
MGVKRPMHLLRRVGPLLIGILLERDSTNHTYLPIFHVHNLAIESSRISLTLYHSLVLPNGAPDVLDVRNHESQFRDAARRMSEQALLPLAGDVALSQVIAAYQKFIADGSGGSVSRCFFEDVTMLYSWSGQIELARASIHEAVASMMLWPPNVRQLLDRRDGALEEWEARMLNRIEGDVAATVLQQITALEVGHLPVSRMLATG